MDNPSNDYISEIIKREGGNTSGPEYIISGEFQGCKIEIFGEIHNKKLESSNIFREISKKDLSNRLIIVEESDHPEIFEHEMMAAIMLSSDKNKFQKVLSEMSGAKMISTLGMSKKLIGNYNIFAADNRLSLGYFMALQILEMKKFTVKGLNKDTIRDWVSVILKPITEVIQNILKNSPFYLSESAEKYQWTFFNKGDPIKVSYSDTFKTLVGEDFDNSYLQVQFNILKSILTHGPGEIKVNLNGEEINLPINILLTSVAQNLIRNIEKNVASISVDLNIIENLIKNSRKYKSIMVFTGLAHAIRIEQVLLNLGGYSPKSQGKDNPEYLSHCNNFTIPFPEGHLEHEILILNELNKVISSRKSTKKGGSKNKKRINKKRSRSRRKVKK